VIKDKTGKSLMQKEEILERWAEYVEELYETKPGLKQIWEIL